MKTFLTRKEASDLTLGMVPELSLTEKAKMVIKGMKNMSAFSNLVYTVKRMKEMNELYAHYPKSPKEFDAFKKKVVNTIEEAKEKFPSSPV